MPERAPFVLDGPPRALRRRPWPWRLRRPRVVRPARGQLRLIWTPRMPAVASPAPAPISPPSRAARRPRLYTGEQQDRLVDRWARRKAGCLLCGAWPAPHPHALDGRLVVLRTRCEARPDAIVRVAEIIRTDWRPDRQCQ